MLAGGEGKRIGDTRAAARQQRNGFAFYRYCVKPALALCELLSCNTLLHDKSVHTARHPLPQRTC